MVKLLIEHGADVNARKADGQTALELAIQHSHPEVAEVLRWRGAAEKMITGGVFLPATATPQKDRSHRRHGELRRIQPG